MTIVKSTEDIFVCVVVVCVYMLLDVYVCVHVSVWLVDMSVEHVRDINVHVHKFMCPNGENIYI